MSRSVVAAVLLALSSPAAAKPKPAVGAGPSACGIKSVPMAAGNYWTYKAGTQQVTVKVINVEGGKDHAGRAATVINVDETLGARLTKTVWTCTGGGLLFPPNSFFFSGEPGGGVNETFNVTARDSISLPGDAGLAADANWVETVKADVVRPDGGGAGAEHPAGKFEVELHVIVKSGGPINVPVGQYKDTTKVGFELRGRGIVEDAKIEIPIKRPGAFYVVKGLGFVKIEDAFDRTWELVDSNLVPK